MRPERNHFLCCCLVLTLVIKPTVPASGVSSPLGIKADWSNDISQQRLIYCKRSPFRLTTRSMSTSLRVSTAFPPSGYGRGLTWGPLTLCCSQWKCLRTSPSSHPSNRRINRVKFEKDNQTDWLYWQAGSCSPWWRPLTPWSVSDWASQPGPASACRRSRSTSPPSTSSGRSRWPSSPSPPSPPPGTGWPSWWRGARWSCSSTVTTSRLCPSPDLTPWTSTRPPPSTSVRNLRLIFSHTGLWRDHFSRTGRVQLQEAVGGSAAGNRDK